MKLKTSFFLEKPALRLAKDLLGKVLVYESEKGIIRGIISETEAYTQEDESCHAFGGKRTKRTETMFKRSGYLYVYFTYGMYHCINIVSGKEGIGEAVLIRSVIPFDEKSKQIMINNRGKEKDISNGPGKLAIAYGFNISHDKLDLLDSYSKVYIEDHNIVLRKISKTKRIGISKAKDLEWRFIAEEF